MALLYYSTWLFAEQLRLFNELVLEGCRWWDPRFRTSALDYPRISFGAKLGRRPVRYRRPSAAGLDAGAQRRLLLLLSC